MRFPALKLPGLKRLGPGLITGAADDDPSGIATYSQAGAQFGYGTLWTLFLTTPLMIAVQMVSARVGWYSGQGLLANLKRHHGGGLLGFLVLLLFAANSFNIAADVAAMGEAARLVAGGHAHWWAVALAALTLALMVWLPYGAYARFLKWITLVLFVYVGAALTLDVPWGTVARSLVWPGVTWNKDYLLLLVAVLGTTISPYLFFWQAGQEAEEAHRGATGSGHTPARDAVHLKRIASDTTVGMTASNVVAGFVTITAAAALHAKGVTDLSSAASAAQALRPVAGDFAFALFAAGIIGTGLLAVPVLAGSAAYAVSDLFGWRGSLDDQPARARGFYAALTLAMAVGVGLSLGGVPAIDLLVWSAVANGVVAVPMMAMLMRLTDDPDAVGEPLPGKRVRWLGWGATALMALAVGAWAVASVF